MTLAALRDHFVHVPFIPFECPPGFCTFGYPGAASRDEGIFVGWALTLTELVPEAFQFPAFDWPEYIFFWPISKEDQPVPSYTKLRGLFKGGILDEIFTKIQRSRANRKLNMAAGKHRENFHGELIEGIVKFYGKYAISPVFHI